eukprot:TRINITY_DN1496_c0_g1_i2.p1 TRINITY_DN1496_c0_g1~~TRINITY_DN1496_c0_g1_i2.p1  ORF type:complete len:338 (+),score=42.95 TRINITY_DN1496_c0_g1_i2:676-1689(+)
MWKEALRNIPRMSKGEFEKLSIVTKYLICIRAAVLIITIQASCLAGLMAYRNHPETFSFPQFLMVLVGLVFCHATNNLLNDIVDHFKGVDQGDYFRVQYGPHPVTYLTSTELIGFTLFSGLTSLAIGIYLSVTVGAFVWYLTFAGAFFLLFYTYPLKYIALGEVSVFLVWGTLMVGGGYYVLTKEWSWNVVLVSVPLSLGITTIIFGKHIDKLEVDKKKGIYTLPVLLGPSLSRYSAIFFMVFQYLLLPYIGYSPISNIHHKILLLIPLLALPVLFKSYSIFSKPAPTPPKNVDPSGKSGKWPPSPSWPLWFVRSAFEHASAFNILYLLAIFIDSIL